MNNTSEINKNFCLYNNIVFSDSYKYFIQECLGPDIPVIKLFDTATNLELTVLDYSSEFRRISKEYTTPIKKKLEVDVENYQKARVQLLLPEVLQEQQDRTYPLILLL